MQNQEERGRLSKEDFLDWKQHPVTHQYFQAIIDRIQELKDGLAATAGQDSGQDRYIVGMIRAFSEAVSVEVNDVIIIEENDINA